VHETPDDLKVLEELLERSYASAGEHLLSIHTPNWRISAEKVCELLTGMCVLNLATVDGKGRPLVSPVDGMFYRGHFWCGSSPSSARARHIAKRPDVSASHTRGEELAVIVHGKALVVDKTAERSLGFKDYAVSIYGKASIEHFWKGDAVYWEIEPRKMFALAPVT
jgi:uncharacterized pyridoxamine 5'-phosphate oxidase family protein